jgi:MFS family permease
VRTMEAARQQRASLLPDSATFWGLAGVLGLFLFAASAPSPLYQIYAAAWHFSPLTLTIVFALYAIALLAALLVTGRLSDHLGRRPVILAAVIIEIAAMACAKPASGARAHWHPWYRMSGCLRGRVPCSSACCPVWSPCGR